MGDFKKKINIVRFFYSPFTVPSFMLMKLDGEEKSAMQNDGYFDLF